MPSRRWVPAGLFLAVIALWAVLPMPAVSQDEGSLRNKIDRSRAREQQLSGAVARLSDLLARTQREIAIVQGRLTEVEADLATARAKLAATTEKLNTQQAKLARLKHRLAHDQAELSAQLVASYKGDNPDLIGLVVGSSSFSDLIERVELAKRLQERNGEIVDRIHASRDETHRETGRLADLEAEQQDTENAVEQRRNALASMREGLASREATVTRVRAARAQALAGTRAARPGAGGHPPRPRRRRERAQQADRRTRGGRARDLRRRRRPVGDPVA